MCDRLPGDATEPVADTQRPQPPVLADPLSDLLSRSSCGDHAAFAELYDMMAARLWGLVRGIVRDPLRCEEVARQAFREIWRTASRFDGGRASAAGWMLAVAHRTAVEQVRSERDNSGYPVGGAPDGDLELLAAVSTDVTAEAMGTLAACSSLGFLERRTLQLAYFEGRTHSEIETLLDLPLGTATHRIRQALVRLQRGTEAPS